MTVNSFLTVWWVKALAIVAAAALAGCASSSDLSKQLNPDAPDKMFADADALMGRGKFDDAAKKFEDIDRDHPYAPEARRAMVMAATPTTRAASCPRRLQAPSDMPSSIRAPKKQRLPSTSSHRPTMTR